MNWLTLNKGSVDNENTLFQDSVDNDAGSFTISSCITTLRPWAMLLPMSQIWQFRSLLIELFPRKTDTGTLSAFSYVTCVLPTTVAALLNQSCLLVLLQGTRDPLFLTGVTFPSEYPIYEETKIKLTVYDVKDKSHDTVSNGTSFFLWEKVMLFHAIGFFM